MTEDDINHDVSKNNETYPEGLSPNEIRRLDANDLDKLSPNEQPSIYKSNESTHVISFDNYKDSISDKLIETHSGHIKPDPLCDDIMKHELKSNKSLSENRAFSVIESKRLIAQHLFSSNNQNNYTRGCSFSPDGLCVLTYNEDNTIRLFDPPQDEITRDTIQSSNECVPWQPALSISIAGPVYDVDWYPLMNSADPVTCCLAVTSQYQPVHLYDAYDGHLRATYRSDIANYRKLSSFCRIKGLFYSRLFNSNFAFFRCYDLVDEVVAARSVTFDPTGQKLYVGIKNEICIFDVNIPGRTCTKRKTYGSKEDGGLKGIVSSIAVSVEALF